MSVSGISGYGGYWNHPARNTTSAGSIVSGLTSGSADDPVQAFKDYMHETPGERMFDAWLGTQKISKAQYAAMSPEEQQKLKAAFEEYMRKKMEEKLDHSSSGGISITA